jgi:hypothetical protein
VNFGVGVFVGVMAALAMVLMWSSAYNIGVEGCLNQQVVRCVGRIK